MMSKQKAGHPGMNATSSQGNEAAFNNEHPINNEQLTEAQRQNNKKRKKNQ